MKIAGKPARYVVELSCVTPFGEQTLRFGLANRDGLRYPLMLGAPFITANRVVVNIDRSFHTFYRGVSPEDVRQGSSGTCSFLASLASACSVASTGVESRIIDRGTDKFDVKYYDRRGETASVAVTFDGSVASDDARWSQRNPRGIHEAWPLILQRAYLSVAGDDYRSERRALEFLVGGRVSFVRLGDCDCEDEVLQQFAQSRIAVATTRDTKSWGNTAPFVPVQLNHAYAVVGVDEQLGVTLYNPRGVDTSRYAEAGVFVDGATDGLDGDPSDGVIRLDWNEFQTKFYAVYIAEPPKDACR